MEFGEERKFTAGEQLCHILNYGEYTLCLACKTIISSMTNPRSRQRRISSHMKSSNHMESMITLFKMSIADPVCDNDGEKYLDIVTNSVFDISVLIGEESSYICQKDKHLVCLMCNSSISKVTSIFTQIKDEIIEHLESVEHANSIKEVCWFYRLNSKKDYLLLHKSIMHCSVCEDTVECKETELLQSAIDHLESNTHEVKQHFKHIGLKRKNENHNESTKKYFKYDESDINERRNEFKVIKSEFIGQTNDPVKLEPFKQLSVDSLHGHKESNNSMKPLNEIKMELLMEKPNLSSSSFLKAEEESQKINQKCPSNSELVEKFLMNTCPFMLQNRQFLTVHNKRMFCTICCKTIHVKMGHSIREEYKKSKRKERCLLHHIVSKEHVKSLNNLQDMGRKVKTVHELFVESDFDYFRTLFENKNCNTLFETFFLQRKPVSTTTKNQSSHLQQQACKSVKVMDKNKEGVLVQIQNTSSSSSCIAEEQSYHNNKSCSIGTDLMEGLMKDTCPFILRNREFITIQDTTILCTICCKTVCEIPIRSKYLIQSKFMVSVLSHIGSKNHVKNLNKLWGSDKERVTVQQLLEKPDLDYIRVLFRNTKDTGPFKVFLPELQSVSAGNKNKRSKMQQQVKNESLDKRLRQIQQYHVCCHQDKRLLDKCLECLKIILKRICPSEKKQITYLEAKNNKCRCIACNKLLPSTDLKVLRTSILTHCKSEEHKNFLKKLIKRKIRKQKFIDKRKRIKENDKKVKGNRKGYNLRKRSHVGS